MRKTIYQPMNQTKRLALVLSGGASKGAFQAGVMSVIGEMGIRPVIITGVSVGALNATLAAEYGLSYMDQVWRNIQMKDVYTKYGIIRTIIRVFRKGGMMSAAPLKKMIDRLIHPDKIAKSGVDLRIGVTNLVDGRYETFGPSHKDFKLALLASTTIPLSVPPVMINGKPYVDGGVRNITPIGDAINMGAESMIIVGTQPRSERADGVVQKIFGSRWIGYIKHSVDIVIDEGFESDYREFERINEIMAIQGNTHPKYRHIPSISIFPEESLGSGMIFDEAVHAERFNLGVEAARKALANYYEQ